MFMSVCGVTAVERFFFTDESPSARVFLPDLTSKWCPGANTPPPSGRRKVKVFFFFKLSKTMFFFYFHFKHWLIYVF